MTGPKCTVCLTIYMRCNTHSHRLYTTPFRENVATTVGLYFDGPAGTLTYYKDGCNLGVAFMGLDKVRMN